MNRIATMLLLLTLVLAAAIVTATAGLLPPTVASHFGRDGRPNGWSTRDFYLALMLGITVGVPLLLFASMAWLPRAVPNSINLPHRDYWLAPARRARTLYTLQNFACAMGIIVAVFATVLHLLVVNANLAAGNELSPAFVALLGVFVTAIGAWTVLLFRRFRRMPA